MDQPRPTRLSAKIASLTLAGVLLGLIACSGSSSGTAPSCASKGSCPNSPAPSSSDVAQCQSFLADPKCGAAFETYFACAATQEKCTVAGITDDAATTAAIGAHCAGEASAYKACLGNTTPTAPACGFTGEACCTSGAPCASTACCDPGTGKCLGAGEACTTPSTVCSAGQCLACGAPAEPCCSILGMTQPNGCPGGGCCNYAAGELGGACIAEGGQCNVPGPTSAETVCHTGSCITCGSSFGSCCAGNKCTDANTACSPSNAMCMPCGGSGQPACM